jgi:hypothetical protein
MEWYVDYELDQQMWEWVWEEEAVGFLGYYSSTSMEGLRNTTKILSQDSKSLVRDSNRVPSEYELTISRRQLSIQICWIF